MSVTVPVAGADTLASFGIALADLYNSRAGITASAAITTTQTQAVGLAIPANTFTAGRTYRILVTGTIGDSGGVGRTVTFRMRLGTTTLTGSIVCSNAPTTSGTASGDGFVWEGWLQCRSTGATGVFYGNSRVAGDSQPFTSASGVGDQTAITNADTTVQNILEATIQTANASCTVTVRLAFMEIVVP